jgi:hypothetical protein
LTQQALSIWARPLALLLLLVLVLVLVHVLAMTALAVAAAAAAAAAAVLVSLPRLKAQPLPASPWLLEVHTTAVELQGLRAPGLPVVAHKAAGPRHPLLAPGLAPKLAPEPRLPAAPGGLSIR